MQNFEPINMQSLDPLERLPEDVVFRILKLLESPACRCTLPLVSKSWRDFLRKPSQVWELVCLKINLNTVDVSRLAPWLYKRAAGIESLGLSFTASPGVVIPRCVNTVNQTKFPRLRELILCSTDYGREPLLDLHQTLLAIRTLESLQHLELQNLQFEIEDDDSSLYHNLKGLTTLELKLSLDTYESGREAVGLPVGLSCLTALKHLVVDYKDCKFDIIFVLPECLRTLQRLEMLSIRMDGVISWGPALATLTALTSMSLESVELQDLPDLSTIMSLQHMGLRCHKSPAELSACTSIKRLRLNIYYTTQRETFGELVAPLKQLEDLHVYDYNQNELPAAIVNLTGLKVLNLPNNRLTSLPAGPYLKHLEVLGLQGHNFRRLPDALEGAPALMVMDLSWGNYTVSAWQLSLRDLQILASLPRLQGLTLQSGLWCECVEKALGRQQGALKLDVPRFGSEGPEFRWESPDKGAREAYAWNFT